MECAARFTGMIAGIGSGKSYAGAVKVLTCAKRKSVGLVIAPTYPMLRDATIRTFLDVADGAVSDFKRQEMRAILRNGAEILFRSATHPDSLRGPNLHYCWIDEGALCPPETWDIAIGRLRADGGAGPCFVTTTPKGRNWLFERADQMTLFKARTRDNPYLSREFVDSLQSAYVGDFARQELEGEFVSFEGLVYEDFRRELHIVERPGPFAYYVAGCDEGYTNPAVILVFGVDADDRLHCVEEYYRRRVLQGDVVAEAKRLNSRYGIQAFVVDPSAAGLIAEMRSVNLKVLEANNEVMPGIQAVKARLVVQADGHPRLTFAPGCVNCAAESESYVWKDGRLGQKDEPEKCNDHAMDATRYVTMYLDARRSAHFG